MIRLEKLNKSYRMGKGALHVLKDLDMEVETGELVSIMGSSGSGKSTLLNVLGLLDGYDTGGYYLEDKLMKDLSERQAAYYRNRFIGFVFQSFNLISFKNAVENVALPLYYQKIPRRKRNRIAMEYLERVGLKDWATTCRARCRAARSSASPSRARSSASRSSSWRMSRPARSTPRPPTS